MWGSLNRRRFVALAAVIALAGCATRGPVEEHAASELLGFLAPGVSTRDEVQARLGSPSRTYENGLLATYTMHKDRNGRLTTMGRTTGGSRFTLVLEYSSDGKLVRRELVQQP